MIMSKLSSLAYFFLIIVRKTSSRIRIMVGRSMFFCLAKSANDSIKFAISIYKLFKRHHYKCFFYVFEWNNYIFFSADLPFFYFLSYNYFFMICFQQLAINNGFIVAMHFET